LWQVELLMVIETTGRMAAAIVAALMLALPNGGEFAVFVGFNLFAGLIGLPGHRLRPHGLTQ